MIIHHQAFRILLMFDNNHLQMYLIELGLY